MTHTKSYPVTNQVNLPQPHVTVVNQKRKMVLCSSWIPFVIVGMGAIFFLVSINRLGGSRLFPVSINIYSNNVPIAHKGYLQVFPFAIDSNDSIQDSFTIKLPLQESEKGAYTGALEQLLKSYPDKYETRHTNCWLENPTKNKPCFYDRSWIENLCSNKNSFGYDEEKEEYSPCFILKFENSEDWKPKLPTYNSLFDSNYGYTSEHFDHGFVPVVCVAKDEGNKIPSTEIYPPKGFSLLYFPVSSFNASSYLPPLVAIKVKRLQKYNNVTIVCSIIAPNAFVLWNNGRVSITFSST